jgi:cytochrome o ubiquinol oxidase subunit 2
MKGLRVVGAIALAVIAVGVVAFLLRDHVVAILQPVGTIAEKQRDLMIFATALMLVIVLPVFALTAFIAWRYRESNTRAKYTPDWGGSRLAEGLWWGLPLLIISILSVVIWKTSHELDPFKPLASNEKPLTVQVVALQWKWLFIYPEQNIASVNHLQIPINTPINFRITSDAPMNSFWIPQMGGQIYSMAGMETKLHLDSTQEGNYRGSSANISGEGFSDMNFEVRAGSRDEFDRWAQDISANASQLDTDTYNELAKPSRDKASNTYSSVDTGLFESIIMKYMEPGHEEQKHNHAQVEG